MNKLLLRNTAILELLRFKDSFSFAISDALGKNKLDNKYSVIMFLKYNSESLFDMIVRIYSFKLLMEDDKRPDLDRECEDLLVAIERMLRIYKSFSAYCNEDKKKPHFSDYKLRVIRTSLRDDYDRRDSIRRNDIMSELLQYTTTRSGFIPANTTYTGDGVQIIGRPSQVEDPF